MKKILLIAVILILIPATALAQSPCGARIDVLSNLRIKFKEVPTAVSITNTGILIELFESNKTNGWTIVTTYPSTQMSCVVFAGNYWKKLNTDWIPFNERGL